MAARLKVCCGTKVLYQAYKVLIRLNKTTARAAAAARVQVHLVAYIDNYFGRDDTLGGLGVFTSATIAMDAKVNDAA
ncbi:hypothetical protein J6590_011746 [Homalodisca vitripennis]|nr:hypothetical protein J6590_011746 [Homalodisca vitripennis]